MTTKEKTSFTLDADIKKALQIAVPKNLRSRFVENAIREALRNEAKEILLQSLENPKTVSSNGVPTETALHAIRMKEKENLLDFEK